MYKKELSIIIPMYNSEKYIERCIESLIHQINNKIEIIVIDDGSTDNSVKKCQKYINSKLIKYIKKKNGGVSSARNEGLKFASGQYIMFVDSDDYLESNSINNVLKFALNNDLDIVKFDYYLVNNSNRRKYSNKFLNKQLIIGKNDFNILYDFLINTYYLSSCCTQIVKRSLFKNIKFPEDIIYGEDYNVNLGLYSKAKSFGYYPEFVYAYYSNNQSATKSKNINQLENKFLSCQKCYYKLLNFDYLESVNNGIYNSYKRYYNELKKCLDEIIIYGSKKDSNIYYNLFINDKNIKHYLDISKQTKLKSFNYYYIWLKIINRIESFVKRVIR